MTAEFDAHSDKLPVDTGIKAADRKTLAKELGNILANTYVLYHKTHAYHWNVVGPLFYSVHKLTDDQYQDLAAAIDDIAERIRALGLNTPVGLQNYAGMTEIEDTTGIPSAGEMIAELAADHQKLAKLVRKVALTADEAEDVYTADLLVARIGVHEEAAWMLNSLIVKNEDGSLAKG